ncbi:hypothetical protein [Phaeacidiphilus oryzae]|uniref:hypothetical protein n=1 Tax=Phaeacidiphilus oryzae TaxID=348818 RepID=UPI000564517D|nr:hypothetical protein [Phaeacidiphilus oryzae]
MGYTTPTAEDLGLFLNLDTIQGDRADLLISLAEDLCKTIVSPLPDGAAAVVLSAASRAYTNPQATTYEVIGPMSVQRPQGSGGLYLTKADKTALKALAGRGGAFTIDPTPKDATPWPSWPPLVEDVWPGER